MPRIILFSILMVALGLSGCNKGEESSPPKEQSAQQTHQQAQTDNAATEQQTQDQTATDQQTVAETTEQAVDKIQEKAETAAEAAAETSEKAADMVAEQTMEAAQAVEKQVEETKQAVASAAAPDVITLEASFGKVSFPHAVHAGFLDCATCHGAAGPGPFELGKDKAHELCKGCHQKEGAGPTGCRDCHQK